MSVGKTLILAGAALLVAGILVLAAERLSIPLGRLPGDIVMRGKNSTFYFPVVTCLLISAALSLILWFFRK